MTDEPEPDDDDGETAGEELASQQPTDDAASIHTIRGKRARQLQTNAEIVMFWRRVLADPVGRRELWNFFTAQCHVFDQVFGAGPSGFPDPQATWFHAGEKAVGDRLYRTLLRNDLDGIRLMHQEHDPHFAQPKPIRKARTS